MVWVGLVTENERVTDVAAAYDGVARPGWRVSEQVPGVRSVTSNPLTVQTAVVVEVRRHRQAGRAVAVTVNGVCAIVLLPGFVNVMVWVAFVTVNERVTEVAGL